MCAPTELVREKNSLCPTLRNIVVILFLRPGTCNSLLDILIEGDIISVTYGCALLSSTSFDRGVFIFAILVIGVLGRKDECFCILSGEASGGTFDRVLDDILRSVGFEVITSVDSSSKTFPTYKYVFVKLQI